MHRALNLGCTELVRAELESGELLAPFDIALTHFSYYLVEPTGAASLSDAATLFKSWLLEETMLPPGES